MTIGEKLLNLTIEYQDAAHREAFDGTLLRSKEEIAADYEATVRELLNS